jgi:N-acetylglucosaminyldiphosphoundecaprenol N-acetyl-beta-D-mannosaminyltransferase
MEKINIGGLLVDRVDIEEACRITADYVEQRKLNKVKPRMIQAVNTDSIVKANIFEEMARVSNKADLSLADGMPLVWVSKFMGKPLKERVTGPDFFEKFNEIADRYSYSYYFLGSTEEVVEKMIKNIGDRYPGIMAAGYCCPPFGDMKDENQNIDICNKINAAKPDVVWVSFGCPKQERWIVENKDKINAAVIMGIGAAFDFVSGRVKRAPIVFQKAGLEWLYRVYKEPRRLWKRYFIYGPLFIKYVILNRNSRKPV